MIEEFEDGVFGNRKVQFAFLLTVRETARTFEVHGVQNKVSNPAAHHHPAMVPAAWTRKLQWSSAGEADRRLATMHVTTEGMSWCR